MAMDLAISLAISAAAFFDALRHMVDNKNPKREFCQGHDSLSIPYMLWYEIQRPYHYMWWVDGSSV